MTTENLTPQDTRELNARQQMVHDYADMPAAQIQYGYDQWDDDVPVDGDELARLRAEKSVVSLEGKHVCIMSEEPIAAIDHGGVTFNGRATVTRPSRSVFLVFPNKGVNIGQPEAQELVLDLLAEGMLPHPGDEKVTVSEAKPLNDAMTGVHPADAPDGVELVRDSPAVFGPNPEEPEYSPTRSIIVHESDSHTLEQADGTYTRSLHMSTNRPDWALDDNIDFWTSVAVKGLGDSGPTEVEVMFDHPDELRVLAGFLQNAANDFESALEEVTAVKARENG